MEHHVNSCELTGVADLQSATWAKKNSKSYFGYKLHSKMDTEHGLIRDIETTTASIHDSQVDLSNPGEVVYRDKGYFGVEPRGYDATMKRAVRGKLLTIRDKLRNVAYSVSNSCLHK